MKYITGVNKQISDLQAEIANAEKNGGMSADMLREKKAALNSNINERTRIEAQLKAATDKAITMSDLERQDPKLIAAFKQLMPGATAGQIYNQIKRTFDNPNDQDYKEFKTAYDKLHGGGSFNSDIRRRYGVEAIGGEAVSYNALTPGSPTTLTSSQPFASTSTATPDIVSGRFEAAIGNKINNAFKEIKTSVLFNAGLIDIGDDKTSVALTKMKNEYFNGKMPFANQTFIVNGEKKTGAQLAAEGYVIKEAAPNLQTNIYQIHLEKGGKNPGSITATYDGRQITSPELRDAMNNPEIRFGSLISQHDTRIAGTSGRIETVLLDGDPIHVNVISQGDGTPVLTFTNPSTGQDAFQGGNPVKYTANDTVVKNAINKGWLKF